jgi:hypothetical protein
MIDMTDMSSTFGESESVTGSVILPGPNRIANKAVIEMGFSYNSVSGKLVVRLVELRQLTSASRNTSVQLRLLLLPDRKQRCKSKLRYTNEDGSTVSLMETFVFSRIEPGELSSTGIRLRLYCSERLRRERLLGEAFVGLASMTLDHQREQSLLVALETKSGPFKVSFHPSRLFTCTQVTDERIGQISFFISFRSHWPPWGGAQAAAAAGATLVRPRSVRRSSGHRK